MYIIQIYIYWESEIKKTNYITIIHMYIIQIYIYWESEIKRNISPIVKPSLMFMGQTLL